MKRAYLSEFIGTFALVFIGAGAAAAQASLVAVALAHGLVLMCMIYAVGHISGAHINPAVTIGMWATKRMESAKAIGYLVFQLLGGILAGYLIFYIHGGGSAGATVLADGMTFGKGVLLEAILTFFLVFVIFGVAVDKRAPKSIYGLAIGMALAFSIFMGGPLTGASLNPARSLGPALASGIWGNHLVYWIGPIVGGLVGALAYDRYLLKGKD